MARSPFLLRLRAARGAVAVAGARLRAQPLRPLLVVGGVALAVAMLVAVLGGSHVARQQALSRELGATPVGERAFRVDRFGLPLSAADYRLADIRVRRATADISGGLARRVLVFRDLRVAGQLIRLAAIDDLAGAVRLRAGRLPRTCTPARCELLQIGARGASSLSEGDLHLVRVGVAALREPRIFGSAAAGAGVREAVIVIAPSIDALQRLQSLRSFYRVYSWLLPLDANELRTWQIDSLLSAESQAQAALDAADPAFRLSGPDQALTDAAGRGEVAARRLVLVGGETSALLLGFAVIAAIGLRRGLANERRRLLSRGARRWQVALATVCELVSLTVLGAVIGIAVGATLIAFVATRADLAARPMLAHALLTRDAVISFLAVCGAATACLLLATLSGEEARRRRLGLVDVAALGAAATVAVALSRGALDPKSVSANSVLLVLLPALIAFIAAVVVSRLLTPAMRLAERLTSRRSVPLRLAVLALSRAPTRTVVSCAFVAVALGLALFAATYRATLARGASDQAAFRVPLDFRVSEGPQLVRPLDVGPLARYRATAPGARAYPVLRLQATAPGIGSSVLSPTVLGLPQEAIVRLRWRSDFAKLSPATIARRLAPDGEPRPRGIVLPAGTVTLPARLHGSRVALALIVGDSRGRTRFVPLGSLDPGAQVLRTRVGRGLFLRGVQVSLTAREQFFLAHDETEGTVSAAPRGMLELGALKAGRRQVTGWRGWLFRSRAVSVHGAGVRLPFAFAEHGARLIFRAAQPTDGRAMPAVVSPDIARAAGGIGREVLLDFQEGNVRARIAAVAARMPTVPATTGPFVLADGGWLATAVNAVAPGFGTANEVWLSASKRAAPALRRPPFSILAVSSRTEIERELAADPLARATARTLAAAAVVALVLAVLGFWVGILSQLGDERSDLFDLEAQGVPPPGLRAQLRTRALILVGLGLAGGSALGAVLTQLVVALVRVSATNAIPEPRLEFDPAWLVSAGSVLALALAAIALAEATALAAFRSRRPERASWSLE